MNDYYDAALKEHRLGLLKERQNFSFIRGTLRTRSCSPAVFGLPAGDR